MSVKEETTKTVKSVPAITEPNVLAVSFRHMVKQYPIDAFQWNDAMNKAVAHLPAKQQEAAIRKLHAELMDPGMSWETFNKGLALFDVEVHGINMAPIGGQRSTRRI